MAEKREKENRAGALALGATGGAILATIATLLLARPVKAAPPDEKIDYLIELQEAIVQLLGQLVEANQAMVQLLQQLLAVAPEGVEVSLRTRWEAGEPEEIFSQEIRAKGTFYTDKMANWTRGKRFLFKVESSLDQAVQVQVIGNIVDSMELATDINGVLPCTANGNISIGLAWDDWHPYVGVRITVATKPEAGILTISAVIQE